MALGWLLLLDFAGSPVPAPVVIVPDARTTLVSALLRMSTVPAGVRTTIIPVPQRVTVVKAGD